MRYGGKEGEMHLYLVQHGTAKSEAEEAARPLSVDGVTDVNRVASFLSHSMKPERIFHSGKLRAEQTAEILGEHLDVAITKEDGLAPMDDPAVWAGKLKGMRDDIVLVGHLPHMGKLASLLLCGSPDAGLVEFMMGCVVCLRREQGKWALQWMVTPGIAG